MGKSGSSWNEQGTQIPFVWTQKAGYRTFLGDSTGFATDINNRGDVVGVRLEGLGAFLWNETTGLVDLGAGFWPLGINNSGVVVGGCNGVTPEETGPCVWTNGVRTVLTSDCGGAALAINERREVVGYTLPCTGRETPFVWRERSGIRSCPRPIPRTTPSPKISTIHE